MPRLLPNERWALTPPFHPYRGISVRDVLQVSLRDATVLHSTGGLFSVALSVNRTARMTCAAAPLTLSGALPIGSRPCDRKPRCPDFPPVLALRLGPAITRLTRYTKYSAGICVGIRNHFFARLGLNDGFYSVSGMRRDRPIPERRKAAAPTNRGVPKVGQEN